MTTSHGKLIGALMAGLLVAAPAGPSLAEGPSPPSVSPPRTKSGDLKREKERLREQIIDKLRAERMWKLTEALRLDEPTAARLFPLMAKYDEQEKAMGKERGEIVRDLRLALEAPTPDNARIDALVSQLTAFRARRHALEAEKAAAVRKVLTPAQMGKLLLLAPKIDDGFRERIREAVQAARQANGLGRRPQRDEPLIP
jgi:Spy/CpxP family protein refolding chaperone